MITKQQCNLINNEQKGLAIIKKRSLTQGQQHLYLKISEKIVTQTALSVEEAVRIYVDFGCAVKDENGNPCWVDYRYKRDESGNILYDKWGRELKTYFNVLLTPEQIRVAALNWLMRNIGCLVLKGYLKVLPVLELE